MALEHRPIWRTSTAKFREVKDYGRDVQHPADEGYVTVLLSRGLWVRFPPRLPLQIQGLPLWQPYFIVLQSNEGTIANNGNPPVVIPQNTRLQT